MPLRARRRIVTHRHVPDLPGTPGAVEELAVEHERAADPGAGCDEDEVARAAPGAGHPLGESGEAGVVVHDHRTAEALGQDIARMHLVPAG